VCDVHEEEEPIVAPVMEEKVAVTDVKKKKVPSSVEMGVNISIFRCCSSVAAYLEIK
jgi:hypothetical protein